MGPCAIFTAILANKCKIFAKKMNFLFGIYLLVTCDMTVAKHLRAILI